MWPPPRTDDSIALQRLVEAQKLAQKKQKSVQLREDGATLDASASSRQQESMKRQNGFQRTASSPAGRVTELVRGLLATRDIDMYRMDRESIEQLRVRASGSYHACCSSALSTKKIEHQTCWHARDIVHWGCRLGVHDCAGPVVNLQTDLLYS